MAERRAKRRDDDPVRVLSDNRVTYWTGGSPGLGRRRYRRFATAAAAQRFAVQLRIDLADERDLQGTIGRLIDDYLDTIEGSVPANTFAKYESALEKWVRPVIGEVFTHQFSIASLTRCFEVANAKRCGPSIIQAIDTVVGAVVAYGADRGDFGGREPLPPSRRRSAKRRYVSLAEGRSATPRSSRRGGGVRMRDARTPDKVDLDGFVVPIEFHAARHAPWRTLAPLKNHEARDVRVWPSAEASLARLVERAEVNCLLPRPAGYAHDWITRAERTLAAATVELGWPPRTRNHALRHHFACYSLAPPPVGHGIDLGKLSERLGHATSEYTARIDIHSLSPQVNWQH